MERSHQIEHEVKLEVGPEWGLPDLAGVFPGAEARPLATVQLETTYFDTVSRRLAQHQITLRRREQRPAEPASAGPDSPALSGSESDDGPAASSEWTVKLPPAAEETVAVEGSLARTEVNWPETRAADVPADGAGAPAGGPMGPASEVRAPGAPGPRESFVRPPSEVSKLLAGVTFGEPLVPIARLSSTRQRTRIWANGQPAAEVDDDSVEGMRLPPGGAPGRAADKVPGPATVVSFREVEVELAEGAEPEVLDAVVARLVSAGARPSSQKSKLATVLQSAPQRPPGGQDVSVLQAEKPTNKPRKSATVASVLQDQARACLEVIVEHDPWVRLDDPDPEHVHKARVATRRLRSVLWAFRRLPCEGQEEGQEEGLVALSWLALLRQELRWLGAAFGAARDADVRVLRLKTESEKLPPADRGAAARVIDAARSEQAVAHQQLLEVMDSERYVASLHGLEALAQGAEAPPRAAAAPLSAPPAELWRYLDVPAPAAMAKLCAAQWRSARRAVRRLGGSPPDEALHRVRIEAKRLRYIAEAAALVARPAAGRRAAQAMAAAATDLQDVLGELHDAVVGEQWLRQLVARPLSWPQGQPDEPGNGVSTAGNDVALVAGELVAAARSTAEACRAEWRQKWQRLERKGLTKWLPT
jgi:CHAD domain-containing protein